MVSILPSFRLYRSNRDRKKPLPKYRAFRCTKRGQRGVSSIRGEPRSPDSLVGKHIFSSFYLDLLGVTWECHSLLTYSPFSQLLQRDQASLDSDRRDYDLLVRSHAERCDTAGATRVVSAATRSALLNVGFSGNRYMACCRGTDP